MSDYYPTKGQKMPQDIYNKTLWHIRGYDRLKKEAEDLISTSHVQDGQPRGTATGDPTSEAAERREQIQKEIATIENALLDIPEDYREVILENVARKTSFRNIYESYKASETTWSKYRMTFIWGVAIRAGFISIAE